MWPLTCPCPHVQRSTCEERIRRRLVVPLCGSWVAGAGRARRSWRSLRRGPRGALLICSRLREGAQQGLPRARTTATPRDDRAVHHHHERTRDPSCDEPAGRPPRGASGAGGQARRPSPMTPPPCPAAEQAALTNSPSGRRSPRQLRSRSATASARRRAASRDFERDQGRPVATRPLPPASSPPSAAARGAAVTALSALGRRDERRRRRSRRSRGALGPPRSRRRGRRRSGRPSVPFVLAASSSARPLRRLRRRRARASRFRRGGSRRCSRRRGGRRAR